MPTNDQQRRALAYLTKTYRASVYGAGEWDEPGIMAALTRVQHVDLGMVVMAAMRCAGDASIKTPAMIGNPSSSVYVERIGPDRPKRNPTPEAACKNCGGDPATCAPRGCETPSTRPVPRDPDGIYATEVARARELLHAGTPARQEDER